MKKLISAVVAVVAVTATLLGVPAPAGAVLDGPAPGDYPFAHAVDWRDDSPHNSRLIGMTYPSWKDGLELDERVGVVPYCAPSWDGMTLERSSAFPKTAAVETLVRVSCTWTDHWGSRTRTRAFRPSRAATPTPEPDPGGPVRPTTVEVAKDDLVVEVAAGEKASFPVTVTSTRGVPTGHVVLTEGEGEKEQVMSNVELWESDAGSTTLATPPLEPGRHVMALRFVGTSLYLPSPVVAVEAKVRYPASITATSVDVRRGESATIDLALGTEGDQHGRYVVSRDGTEIRSGELVAGTDRFTLPPAADGSTTYDVDYLGTDTTAAATTAFTVTSGDWIETRPDVFHATAGEELVVPAPGVLKNDGIRAKDAFVHFLDPGRLGGSISPDGSVRLTPPASFRGTDTMRYRVQDLSGGPGPRRSLEVPVRIIVGDPWVEDVVVEGQRVGTDHWVDATTLDDTDDDVPATTAGDPTRLAVDLTNPSTTARTVTVDVVDDDSGASVLEKPAVLTMAPRAKRTHTVPVSTWTKAYDADGKAATGPRAWTVRVTPSGVEPIERTVQATVAPRPVVLLHGYMSDAVKGWGEPGTYADHLKGIHPDLRTFAVGDGRYPGRMWTGSTSNPLATTNTIAQNADEAAQYVAALRADTNAHHVDLVAHSMGGLISRYYVSELMPRSGDHRPVVGRLIQMGTPNMGSPCADRLIELNTGVLMPATFQLSSYYLNGWFNRNITDLKGVPISNMVGNGVPIPCSSSLVLGDGVVPWTSASWTLPPKDRPQKVVDHVAMTTDAEVIRRYLAPRLNDTIVEWTPPSSPLAAAVSSLTDAVSTVTAPSTFATSTLEVPAGETRTWSVDVPAGDAFGVTTVATGATLEVRDAAGAAVGEAVESAHFPGVKVSGHVGGGHEVRVTNLGDDDLSVPLAAWVAGSDVSVTVTEASLGSDGSATVRAQVRGAEASEVTVRVLDAGTEAGEAVLRPAGDGTWTGSVDDLERLPDQVVAVRAETPDGARSTTARLVVDGIEDRGPAPAAAPVVVRDPQPSSVTVGATATFGVATAGPVTSITWQRQAPGSTTWRKVTGGAERLEVSVGTLTADGARYRAVVTSAGGTVRSRAATLTVRPASTRTSASYDLSSTATGTASVVVSTAVDGLVPRGVVAVQVDGRVVGRGTLGTDGRAEVRVPALAPGTHQVRVRYGGLRDTAPSWSRSTTVRLA